MQIYVSKYGITIADIHAVDGEGLTITHDNDMVFDGRSPAKFKCFKITQNQDKNVLKHVGRSWADNQESSC